MAMDLGELHSEIFGSSLPTIPPNAKALECLLVGLINGLKEKEAIKKNEVAAFLIEVWGSKLPMALLELNRFQPIPWPQWQNVFHYIAEHKIYDNSREARPEMDGKTQCEIPDCTFTPEEWDHIWPFSWGGPNEEWNYMHLCRTHNRMKSSSLMWFTLSLVIREDYYSRFKQWVDETF
ncbi:HNH endonuclease [Candidatus Poseidoniales archaeon]|nr:HNH endonuclease [Candidatus Poseidoniales archaeon]